MADVGRTCERLLWICGAFNKSHPALKSSQWKSGCFRRALQPKKLISFTQLFFRENLKIRALRNDALSSWRPSSSWWSSWGANEQLARLNAEPLVSCRRRLALKLSLHHHQHHHHHYHHHHLNLHCRCRHHHYHHQQNQRHDDDGETNLDWWERTSRPSSFCGREGCLDNLLPLIVIVVGGGYDGWGGWLSGGWVTH